MEAFAFLCIGWEGFLTFCIMLTAGLWIEGPAAHEARGRILGARASDRLRPRAQATTGRPPTLWPRYGTGPPPEGR